MKKIFFVLLFFILTSTQTYAQFAVGVHGTGAYAFPTISSSSNGNIGYGGGANVMYFVNDQFSIGVNASYTNVMGVNNSADYSLIGVAPSFMFLIGMDNSPYFGFDVGAYFQNFGGVSTTSYGGALNLGYLYGVSDIVALNINLRPTVAYDFQYKNTLLYLPVNIGLLFILGGEGGSTWGRKLPFTKF